MTKSKSSFHDCLIFEEKDQPDSQLSLFDENPPQNLTPPQRRNKTEGGLFKKRQKAQISSIAGLPITHPNRYRVKLGDEILGEYLAIDEALSLAKTGSSKFNRPAK